MSKRLILAVLLAVVAVSALLAVWLLRGGDGSTRAQGDTVEMGIDPEVTGNTANTLGTLEDCVRVDVASPEFDDVSDYDIDVYVRGDTQAPVAYDAWMTYDATKVHIAAPGTNTLIKLPGASSFSDAPPDTDGKVVAGAVYFSGGPGTAGDGTLVRLGLDIGGSGVVTFDFDPDAAATAYRSAGGEHPITRSTAQLAINEDCPRRGEGAEATTTPEPGGCPPPARLAPADLPQRPPDASEPEPPGRRVQGGVPYSEGYLTIHVPSGREFIIFSQWSQGDSGLVTWIRDVFSRSDLFIRGDGCEMSRLVRDASADAVFDEVLSSLEVGATYACPTPLRTTPEDLPVEQEPPAGGTGPPGRRVQGGEPLELGPITLHLPAGREFLVGGGVSDPGGEFFTVTDVQTRSGVFLRPDGCETSRLVRNAADDAVLDQIVRTLEVRSR